MAGENFEGQAIKLAELALKADPKMTEAHEVMARVSLEDNDSKKAAESANKALEIDKESLDAMAVLGTIDLLADKNDTPWFPRLLAINPKYGDAYATAAHFFIINRRYDEGIEMYRQGAGARSPPCRPRAATMGINLMRIGKEDEAALQALEQCIQRGLSERGNRKLADADG